MGATGYSIELDNEEGRGELYLEGNHIWCRRCSDSECFDTDQIVPEGMSVDEVIRQLWGADVWALQLNRIWSEGFENVVLWEDEPPARKTLDVAGTDIAIASWLEDYEEEHDCAGSNEGWEALWQLPAAEIEGIYVWDSLD